MTAFLVAEAQAILDDAAYQHYRPLGTGERKLSGLVAVLETAGKTDQTSRDRYAAAAPRPNP